MSSDNALVSVIMPLYNCQDYVYEAIHSVLKQNYTNLELIIINDGSTDNTESLIKEFDDNRIIYYYMSHKGVSAAKNKALGVLKGDYFCVMDGDDFMPRESISSRIKIFQQNPNLSFVDGKVLRKDPKLNEEIGAYIPNFKGVPLPKLLKISEDVFFGNSWLIKRKPDITYHFEECLTHSEDLYFYLTIANDKLYDFTDEEVLHYSMRQNSAMFNFIGLENGYYSLFKLIQKNNRPTLNTMLYLKYKIIRIMVLSYLFDKRDLFAAVRVFFRFLVL